MLELRVRYPVVLLFCFTFDSGCPWCKGGRSAACCFAGRHRDFVAQAKKVLQGHCRHGQGTFRFGLSR